MDLSDFEPGTRMTLALAFAAIVLCLQTSCAQLPSGVDVRSAPCPQAPRIDGRLDPGEWDAAAHYTFSMQMNRTTGPVQPRPAELWVMNSDTNLYIALRVPDAERQASLDPVKCDLMILAFCRGEKIAAGDDRKILLPMMYGDKHVVVPGQDADDKVKNGNGAMRWEAGQWTAEYGFPLNSGDGEDLAARPGDRVKFNLVFADDFAPKLEGTEFGGVFTPSADDANGWGFLALAGNVGPEKPASEPGWLVKLFPNTAEPDTFAHRFRRLDSTEIPIGDDFGGQLTVEFLYRTFDGKTEKAQACVYLPPQVRRDPKARVPLMYNAGYELDAGSATGLAAKGWIVSTPHANPVNPMDRGPNLDVALLHATRALPCVDDAKVMIQGGSAGGYMTLMLTAESFPLVCATPMVPPVNWGYNAAYFLHNSALARAIPPGGKDPTLPVLTVVLSLAEIGVKTLGDDTDADSWLMASPLSQLDSITAPVQVVWSTGDMLVPVDQVGAQFLRAPKPGVYPDGFTSSIAALMKRPQTRARLLDLLPKSSYETFLLPLPAGAPSLTTGKPMTGQAPALDLPFSKTRVWSIDVVDEGPPQPAAGHFCYWFNPAYSPFMDWALARGIVADQITVPKLTRLMMRLQGKEYRPVSALPSGAATPVNVVRLDFPAAERADVLQGLIAFAADAERAKRLGACYSQLPPGLKALGPALGSTPEAIRRALQAAQAH
jgi:hypothetical protein